MNIERLIPRSHIARIIGTCALAVYCALAIGTLSGCSSDAQNATSDTEQTQTAEDSQQESEQESITAHGSTYEKAETVTATTTLSGETTAIAVEEWLKNPSGKSEIDDVSTLQQISSDDEAIKFTSDGDKITWQTNGQDVHYSGITDQELPFSLSYAYELDGKEVDPKTLKNVTGHLKISITYKNNTAGTVSAAGKSYSVKQPYAMASLVSFDAEHAKNVEVDNGQVIDQEGTFIAAGLAMPGLADSLDLTDTLELPEQVTIEADVTGFDMPDITTMASNQTLSMFDEETSSDVSSKVDELFDKLSSIKKATKQLSQGTASLNKALSTISERQAKLNAAFPNASEGLSKLATAASGAAQLTDGAKQKLESDASAQEEMEKQLDSLKEQLKKLKGISTSGMDEDQKKELSATTDELEKNLSELEQALDKSKSARTEASSSLAKASETSTQVSSGLTSAAEGLKQIQAGYEQLGKATAKLSKASKKLSRGTSQMSKSVAKAIKKAHNGINEKIDLIQALSKLAEDEGAFCGNASDMPATTTFVLTAKADA
ncbi:MAG: hypothetical protein Q4A43_05250 [Coriobacteriia bacterium]|nr:hypothetical protein [Coriobacteriia bacterium]